MRLEEAAIKVQEFAQTGGHPHDSTLNYFINVVVAMLERILAAPGDLKPRAADPELGNNR